ncbi:MAG: hypothetical protein AAGK32_03245, partial [Actinomycetota bacterium]
HDDLWSPPATASPSPAADPATTAPAHEPAADPATAPAADPATTAPAPVPVTQAAVEPDPSSESGQEPTVASGDDDGVTPVAEESTVDVDVDVDAPPEPEAGSASEQLSIGL